MNSNVAEEQKSRGIGTTMVVLIFLFLLIRAVGSVDIPSTNLTLETTNSTSKTIVVQQSLEYTFDNYVREMGVLGVSVQTGDHAVWRHRDDAYIIRDYFGELAKKDPNFWNRPPCRDGRIRIIARAVGLSNSGDWAVWVLNEDAPGVMGEITAFFADKEEYIKKILRDCGHDKWVVN